MELVLSRLLRDETINITAILAVLLMMVFLMAWQTNNPLRAEKAATSAAKWNGKETWEQQYRGGSEIKKLGHTSH